MPNGDLTRGQVDVYLVTLLLNDDNGTVNNNNSPTTVNLQIYEISYQMTRVTLLECPTGEGLDVLAGISLKFLEAQDNDGEDEAVYGDD